MTLDTCAPVGRSASEALTPRRQNNHGAEGLVWKLALTTHDMMHEVISYSTAALEASGLAVIMIGAVVSSLVFLFRLRRFGFEASYRSYRADLGRGILLGLELLIAADILRSLLIDPTLNGLILLGGIVLVRTFLSFSLEVEINGHWPWESTRLNTNRGATSGASTNDQQSSATSLSPPE